MCVRPESHSKDVVALPLDPGVPSEDPIFVGREVLLRPVAIALRDVPLEESTGVDVEAHSYRSADAAWAGLDVSSARVLPSSIRVWSRGTPGSGRRRDLGPSQLFFPGATQASRALRRP
jgi:hypothetical protein